MKTELQIDITFDQILFLVKQLPQNQKIELTQELEKEMVSSKLTKLLGVFKTEDLSFETIDEAVESVRQEIYDKQKR